MYDTCWQACRDSALAIVVRFDLIWGAHAARVSAMAARHRSLLRLREYPVCLSPLPKRRKLWRRSAARRKTFLMLDQHF